MKKLFFYIFVFLSVNSSKAFSQNVYSLVTNYLESHSADNFVFLHDFKFRDYKRTKRNTEEINFPVILEKSENYRFILFCENSKVIFVLKDEKLNVIDSLLNNKQEFDFYCRKSAVYKVYVKGENINQSNFCIILLKKQEPNLH
jgi:hypothetical protein